MYNNIVGVEDMRNIHHVKTPENVTLEFELAGVGSRGVAVIIDTVIQSVILFFIALIVVLLSGDGYFDLLFTEENTLYIVLSLLLIFVIQFGYFLLFEFFTKGLTPGKKIVGLKVIMANGEPLSFTAALIRNLLRIGDMLPGIYGVGIISLVLNNRYMRVGDLAANTVVIKDKNKKTDFSTVKNINEQQRGINITPKEEALLMEYMERCRDPKNPLNSMTLENQLYHHFYGKIGPLPNLPDKVSKRIYLQNLLKYMGIN